MEPIERIAIERACERLIIEFVQRNDFGDLEGLADLFSENGSFARPLDPDNPVKGRTAILEMLRARPPRLSRHFMSNILVTVDSPQSAQGISYVTFLSTTDVEAARPVVCEPKIYMGEYRDTFVKVGSDWKIESRRGAMSMVLAAG